MPAWSEPVLRLDSRPHEITTPVLLTNLRDRGNVHERSKAVRAYLADHPSLETERLHRRPELLASYIRHARIPIHLRL